MPVRTARVDGRISASCRSRSKNPAATARLHIKAIPDFTKTELGFGDFRGVLIAEQVIGFGRVGVCATACGADQVSCSSIGEARIASCFLRSKSRRKDGKEHSRVGPGCRKPAGSCMAAWFNGRLLYLGEINDSQKAAWSKGDRGLR